MDFTKDLKILEIIKKHIYCDKHKNDELIGFMILKSQDKEYQLIKDYFNLQAKPRPTFTIEDNLKENKSFYERNKDDG